MSKSLPIRNFVMILKMNGIALWTILRKEPESKNWIKPWKYLLGLSGGDSVKMIAEIEGTFLIISQTSTQNSTTSSIRSQPKNLRGKNQNLSPLPHPNPLNSQYLVKVKYLLNSLQRKKNLQKKRRKLNHLNRKEENRRRLDQRLSPFILRA